MKERLEKLLQNSCSLYYHYPVAAILECHDGTLFEGINVETSSPQAGICAERNALFQALSRGYQKDQMKAFHLMSLKGDILYPCFICRQALLDYCPKDLPIMIYSKEEETTVLLNDLVPYTFSSEDLK